MDSRSHIIGRQIFEVDFSSFSRGHELQNKISSLFNVGLRDRMETLFDRIIPANKVLKVDNLTIDIGEIKFELLDVQFVDRIIEKLESEISLLLLRDNSAIDGNEQYAGDEKRSYLSLLEYFLLKGTLPWWASAENSLTPFSAVEFLLKHFPEGLVKLLMKIGQNPYVRKRLVLQFTEMQIRALISILEPSEAEFIFDFYSEIVKDQRRQQFVKTEESEFKKAVLEFILTYLIVDRGSHFNRKEFVRSTLQSMAANFNVSFEGLINLFALSLVAGANYLKNVDSLQSIVLEIALENGTKIKGTSPLEKMLEIPIETSDSGIDLLRYFLTFGSLPWWSINVNEDELEVLMSVMIKKYPKTVESLIRSVGQRQYSRRLIATTFKENTLKDILKSIEPENAEFIIDFVQETRITHTKNAVFKTQGSELNKALWEFILEYLLIDRGSEFNRQSFLESNIRQLVNRFNLNYQDLLVFMVNNMAVAHHSSSRHSGLFQGLSSLYTIHTKNKKPDDLMSGDLVNYTEEIFADTESNRTIKKTNLLNVLYFWIRRGHKPWWAGHYMNISPILMLEELIIDSPSEALVFLKHAGIQINTRKRLVYQVPFPTLINLFRLLPLSGEIIRHTLDLLSVIRDNKAINLSNQAVTERILLFSLWETLMEGSYSELKTVSLIKSAFLNLALWFQIPVKRLVNSLKINKYPELRSFVDESFHGIEQENIRLHAYNSDLLEEWSENNSIEQILFSIVSERDQQNKAPLENDLLSEALSILIFFLSNDKLPERFRMYSQSSVNSLLKQTLLFLFKKMPSELQSVLSSDKYKGESFLRIHELFTIPQSTAENELSSALKIHLEKYILLYIHQHGNLQHRGKSMLSLMDSYINETGNKEALEFLKKLLKYSSISMQLAYYYKNDTTYKLISSNVIQTGWGNQTTTFLKSFNLWLLEKVSDSLDRERLDLLFRTFNFMMIGGGTTIGNQKNYLNYLFKFLFDEDYQLMLKLAILVKDESELENIKDHPIASSIALIQVEIKPYLRFKEVALETANMLTESEIASLKTLNPDIENQRGLEKEIMKQELAHQKSQEPDDMKKEQLSDEDKIYIRNAGLVILHPFLSTYFNRLAMLDKGDFISENMRHRAVHLLQYLAFGTETNEEHELVLNKILCNIPVGEPIIPAIELTEHEKTVSSELLNAVIVQWDKLKNSSAGSLQASFIQRDGALHKVEENWNLKVEVRGYDVLLSTLPWGLGMVKTPWMTDFIYVEWM